MAIRLVTKANPWRNRTKDKRWDALGSMGDADRMIISQHNFPNEFDDEVDTVVGADEDRLRGWNREAYTEIFKQFLSLGGQALPYAVPTGGPLQWLVNELFYRCGGAQNAGKPQTMFNGYRIVASVGRDQYPLVGYDASFIPKHSKTLGYSGTYAPNINGYIPNSATIEFHDRRFYVG